MRGLVIALFAASALACSAQSLQETLDKAPPDVDAALRARVTEFCRLQDTGKFREAEALVAEDSKDAYYAAPKKRYDGFEIIKILYLKDFTQARAVVTRGTYLMVAGRMMPVKAPFAMNWKLEKGQWCWYVPLVEGPIETPFGVMHPGPYPPGMAMPGMSTDRPTVDDIRGKVKLDKTSILLRCYETSSDEIHISNDLPGEVQLSLAAGQVSGLEVKLDRNVLKSGESARLSFHFVPDADKGARRPITVQLRVEPLGEAIPIEVKFDFPPDVKKALRIRQ